MMVKNPEKGRSVLKIYSSRLDGGLFIESKDNENIQCKFSLDEEGVKQLCDILQQDLSGIH